MTTANVDNTLNTTVASYSEDNIYDTGGTNEVVAVAADTNGVYLLESNTVHAFDRGSVTSKWTYTITGTSGEDLDADGTNIWVTDDGGTVAKLDSSGTEQTTTQLTNGAPAVVALTSGKIVVLEDNGTLHRFPNDLSAADYSSSLSLTGGKDVAASQDETWVAAVDGNGTAKAAETDGTEVWHTTSGQTTPESVAFLQGGLVANADSGDNNVAYFPQGGTGGGQTLLNLTGVNDDHHILTSPPDGQVVVTPDTQQAERIDVFTQTSAHEFGTSDGHSAGYYDGAVYIGGGGIATEYPIGLELSAKSRVSGGGNGSLWVEGGPVDSEPIFAASGEFVSADGPMYISALEV